MEAKAMTKIKIPMPKEWQSSKSEIFGIGAWDFIWHLNLELWRSFETLI